MNYILMGDHVKMVEKHWAGLLKQECLWSTTEPEVTITRVILNLYENATILKVFMTHNKEHDLIYLIVQVQVHCSRNEQERLWTILSYDITKCIFTIPQCFNEKM